MDETWRLVEHALTQCGVLTALALAWGLYQTMQLGRLRGQVEEDRRQVIEDAKARTRTAEAIAEAQQETVLRLIQRRSEGRRGA